MSQSCRTHLFFGARLIQQNSRFESFLLAYFFSFFWWTCLSKYTRKDMTDTMKHFEQQTFSTQRSVLHPVHSKIKLHISKLWPTQIWHVCFSGKKKLKKKKKNAIRSGLPIWHKFWDIAFFFFSLIIQWIIPSEANLVWSVKTIYRIHKSYQLLISKRLSNCSMSKKSSHTISSCSKTYT